MKRLVLAVGFLVACTGDKPPLTPDPTPDDAAVVTPPQADGGTEVTMTTSDAATAPPPAAPLPPPKPATTPLASSANDAIDKELTLGDSSVEAI